MDFLDPKNKRSYNIRLFIGFTFTAMIIILGTTIMALIISGYSYNSKSGEVYQNGLMFINSSPVSAKIYLNHAYYGMTNNRAELQSGSYRIDIYAPGYDTWTNIVNLLGGTVDELTYPLLIPSKPKVTTIATETSKPQVFTQSPDKHWLLISSSTVANSFDVYDQTNTATAVTTATIPDSLLVDSKNPNTFSVIQWASNNTDVLLKDDASGSTNYIVFNYTNPGASYNINQTYSQSFTSVKFLNSQYDKTLLFDQTSGNLYLATLNSKLATLILSDVIQYTSNSTNEFLYAINDPKDPTMTSIRLSDLTNDFLVKNVTKTTNYILDISSYSSDTYFTIGGQGNYDYIYKDLFARYSTDTKTLPLPFTMMVNSSQAQNVANSTGSRFISLQSGNNFSIFDIFTQDHFRFQLNQNISTSQFATWMDDNRLQSYAQDKLTVFDFDGTNLINITTADNTFPGLFSPNYNAVYVLNQKSDISWLVDRASLIAGK
jgi:hypothetical protein